MDVLSEVLRAVRLTGAVVFDVEARSPWAAATPDVATIKRMVMPDSEHVMVFHVLTHGSVWCELRDGSTPPLRLNAGDLVVLPMGDPHMVSSVPGMRAEPNLANYYRPSDRALPLPFVLNEGGGPERCHFVCGYLGCDAQPFNPLLEGLPRIFHASVSTATRGWLMSLIRVAVEETMHAGSGGETMLAKLAELMFVEVVRKYVDGLPKESRGWLSGLRDHHIGVALRLIHGRPAEAWTLDALARSCGMSRSAFADRFTYVVGIPPMQYLVRWRLQLAARFLESGAVGISIAAARVGYGSEAAFNRAFKRFVGVPPGAWRKSRAAGLAALP